MEEMHCFKMKRGSRFSPWSFLCNCDHLYLSYPQPTFSCFRGNPTLQQPLKKVKVLVAQLPLTLCDPMDCSLPGSSVHGIPWPRILEGVASSFSNYGIKSGIKSGFPALQADSLPFESLGKPILACRFYFQFSQLLSLDLEKRADD